MILESLIINDILILFPMLYYQYYIVHQSNLKKEKLSIVFSMCLFIGFYLSIKYIPNINKEFEFISIVLPLIIASLYNKRIDSYTMMIILLVYYDNTYIMGLFLIIYIIIYEIYRKSDKDNNYFINVISVLISLISLIINYNNIVYFILSSIIFIFNINIINYILNESNKIIDLHMNIKDFEKEKNIKINLFKITHEIKNPLAVIKGYIDMFDVYDSAKSERYINIMKGEITRTLNLLTDFVEFTRISINKDLMSLNSLFDDIKEVLMPLLLDKKINYKFNIENNININADYNRLKQVILNIIKNSIEACDNYGSIIVSSYVEKNTVYIYVKDNGKGMEKEVLDKLSTPFFTTKENGTGLGVSLSKEIISSHKGTINYNSTPKKGTVCKITIPC